MTGISFFKKAVFLPAAIVCILSIASAAVLFGYMNDRDLQLISSLCDRISADRGTAGADIAFLLITALIVLS
jgi:hypothetical protein